MTQAQASNGAAHKPNGGRIDLTRKQTREVAMSNHFTERAVGLAVRVDQITTEMDRALSRKEVTFSQSIEIQQRMNGLLDAMDEELRQMTRAVRKSPSRSRNGRNRTKPVNGSAPPAQQAKTAPAKKAAPKKKAAAKPKAEPKTQTPDEKVEMVGKDESSSADTGTASDLASMTSPAAEL